MPVNIDAPVTTERLIASYEAARPGVLALSAQVEPQALRRPAHPVPAGLVAEARRVLAEVEHLVARRPGRGHLRLADPVDWATLAARLAAALAVLNRFRAEYRDVDQATYTGFWRTYGAVRYFNWPNGLRKNRRDLST